jgi:hypothetical protein
MPQFKISDMCLFVAIVCKILELQSLRHERGSADAIAPANIQLAGA